MEPLTDHASHATRASRNARGVTLIEMLFVIGIIAIIVVAALAIFNTVRASQDRSTALQQVSSIRTAVATWAGDKPLNFGDTGGLQRVEQLQPWLHGRLRTADIANSSTSLVLGGANPWDGAYEIGPSRPAGAENQHPYRFNLAIGKIPSSEAEALCRQLEDGAAITPEGNKLIELKQGEANVADPTGNVTPCALGENAQTVHTILITYRV